MREKGMLGGMDEERRAYSLGRLSFSFFVSARCSEEV